MNIKISYNLTFQVQTIAKNVSKQLYRQAKSENLSRFMLSKVCIISFTIPIYE